MSRFDKVGATVALAAIAMAAAPRRASAEGCEAETSAVQALGRPDPSLAPPTHEDAKRHLSEGNKRHRVQDYDQAVEAYKSGALIDGAPVFLYNLGQAYRLGGQYEKSIRQYKLFLDRGAPGPELRALIECHIGAMTRELDQAASKEQPTGPAPETGAPGPVASTTIEPARARGSADADAPAWYADGLGWGLTGTGAALALTGLGLHVNAASLDDQAAREDREDVRTELRDRADTRRLWGTGLAVVGLVGLGVGVVRLVLTPDAPIAPRDVTVIAGPRSIGLAWTF
jgi:tetratricopeptide (TPR) repeat protein